MKILVACEFSGIVRDEFKKKGHEAWSCDLLPTEQPGQHILDNVLIHLRHGWDLIIAHVERWREMEAGAQFFKDLINSPVGRIAIENPIMHKYAKEIIGINYAQVIQPWQFGHGEVKATCLWLKGLPLLKPSNIVDGRNPKVHFASPSPERWKERSRTYKGIAEAMADQWG